MRKTIMFRLMWTLLAFYMFQYFAETVVRGDVGFRYSRCLQDKQNNIQCAPFEHMEDENSAKSLWPPGPYAIPMTIDGCPETKLQGWEKGYLSITWTNQQTVFTKYQTENESISIDGYHDILQTRWPGFQTYVFGPFKGQEFSLNFCYKQRHNDSLDTGNWPNGDYHVYSAQEACPTDFQKYSKNITLPEISQWSYDGYVPDFQFFKHPENVFQIWLCARTKQESVILDEGVSGMLNDAPFMLIQNVDEDCFVFDDHTVRSERLYIGEYQENDTIKAKLFQTFCFYQPDIKSSDLDLSDDKGYLVSTAVTIAGNVSLTSEETDRNDMIGNYEYQDIFRTLENNMKDVVALKWRMIDLGRTISISAIEIFFIDGFILPSTQSDDTLHLKFQQKLGCFISDIKWSFLNFGAFHCPYTLQYQTKSKSVNVPFLREKHGRFITFVSNADDVELLEKSSLFDVYTHHVVRQDRCNIDMGMIDGDIQDFQITASSFHPLYPPSAGRILSSGWCANSDDIKPYIIIDLLYTVKIEALTISNWEQIVNIQDRSRIYLFGSKSLAISYGYIRESLQSYFGKLFHIDMTQLISEWQTFWFYYPFNARFVKVEIIEALLKDLSCLRVELHGCRKSGIPSLNCPQGGTLVDSIKHFPVSLAEESTVKDMASFETCKALCKQTLECSSVMYDNVSICTLYKQENTGNWQFKMIDDDTYTSTKLCWDSSVANVPSLIKEGDSSTSVISLFTLLYTDVSSTSVGYPISYPGGQKYTWIVSFEENNYVKLIFTNITLHEYVEGNRCNDSILISDKLDRDDSLSRMVDNRFNRRMFIIETSVTRLVMTFTSCLPLSRKIQNGYGFRTVFTRQDTPACFALSSRINWEHGRSEKCVHDSMTLTPLSTLGLPFSDTMETWELDFPRHRIQLHFVQFQVKCKRYGIGSEFKITDLGKERSYCVLEMPPTPMDLMSDYVTVSFYKLKSAEHFLYVEGFVIKYTVIYETADQVYKTLEHQSEVWNVALGKLAIGSSRSPTRIETREVNTVSATDGAYHADSRSGSCFSSLNQYEPWWVVDLQHVYSLDWVVIYNRMDCCYYRLANVEISVGLTIENMLPVAYICEEAGPISTLEMHNVSARYLQIQLRHMRMILHLCEVRIFGRLERKLGSIHGPFNFPESVDGQWGSWGPWSNICFCNSSQPRRRLCDNPRQNFGGQLCKGSDTSYRTCLPRSPCELHNIAVNSAAFTSSMFLDHKAEFGIDGSLSTCFHTQKDYQPWIMVKLDNIYILHHLVIYNMKSNVKRTKSIEVTAGLSECTMETIYFQCGEAIADSKVYFMSGTIARYIKLQIMGIKEYLHLCEVEVYGQNASKDMTKNIMTDECDGESIVDGGFSQWSMWGECSESCGHGKRIRTRSCTNPAQANGGKSCYGKYKDITSCFGTCTYCSESFGKCYSLFPEVTNWRHAGVECWHKGMQLVSIRSKEELRFVKYLLRENRYKDIKPIIDFAIETRQTLLVNVSHYTHIGLLRINKGVSETMTDVWEDNTPVTFNAWNLGQPSKGYCTRMNFRLLTYDNTWESEDCETHLAEYYVCEKQFYKGTISHKEADRYVPQRQDWTMMITEQIMALEYDGKENVTSLGQTCLPWSVSIDMHPNYPIDDIMFPEQSRHGAENYCRDPNDNRYLWCWTGPSDLDYGDCSAKLPSLNISMNYSRLKYTGKVNKTYSGKTCQSWTTKTPHTQISYAMSFPGETILSVENYCRDPWNSGYLWCHTMDPNTRWEPCVIPDDMNEMCSLAYHRYSGSLNSTFSGKPCRKWNPLLLEQTGTSQSSNQDLKENTCRDPFNDGFLWCYTDEADWEPCIIYGTGDDHFKEMKEPDKTHEKATFRCEHGQHIPDAMKCDGKFDCEDFSDETDCKGLFGQQLLTVNLRLATTLPEDFEPGSFFHCNTSEWVSIIVRCDKVIDCLDASDETGCRDLSSEEATCLPNQFKCNDGDCIHISQVCNFVSDCIDNSDEHCNFDTCEKSEYACDNHQCIPVEQRCNSEPDCLDGSDERSCDECQTEKAFHCDIERCIPTRLLCDNYKDCEDGKDELNCEEDKSLSCADLWEAGSQETGIYSNVIPYTDVICNFDSIHSQGKIYTIVKNSDIVLNENNLQYFLISRLRFWVFDDIILSLDKRKEMTCTQEIKQTCIPSHEAASRIDDANHTHNYKHCDCIIIDVDINYEKEIAYPCNERNVVEHSKRSYNTSDLVYINELEDLYRKISLTDLHSSYYQITAGPLTCKQEYKPKMDKLSCEGEVRTIPNYFRCLYDVDKNGMMIGCKSGSHLYDCGSFSCPENFVKCPDSYCIPIKFVCDGKMQCPDGQDEESCGCLDAENEIIILYDAEGDIFDIEEFSKQFFTEAGAIRLLSYTQETPLKENFNLNNAILNIIEEKIFPFSSVNRQPLCRYKLMASSFLQEIAFSKINTSKRGVIFIQNSKVAEKIAMEMFENLEDKIQDNVVIYRIIEDSFIEHTDPNEYEHVTDVRIRRWKMLEAIGASFFQALCKLSAKVECPNSYKCIWSKTCIPLHQVCDGFQQCIHGDDENLCHFRCHHKCNCSGFAVFCNSRDIQLNQIDAISKQSRLLDLSHNQKLKNVLENKYLRFPVLINLNLSKCDIKSISTKGLQSLVNLRSLDLSNNRIKILKSGIFSHLVYLFELYLQGNDDLTVLEPGTFEGLFLISTLQLAGMQINKISANSFRGLKLKSIDLSVNRIEEIEPLAFNDLYVEEINFESNEILNFNKEVFTGVIGLKKLFTPAFKFCCIRPNYLDEDQCYPKKDEFSSCEDLMRLSALQTILWLVGLTAIIGNALTIMYRLVYDRERLKIGFGIFVTNLAAADFLMGIYLMMIAIADAVFRKRHGSVMAIMGFFHDSEVMIRCVKEHFRDAITGFVCEDMRYIFFDDYWRNSAWCNLAGFLTTVSSEASVMFLCLITLDRLLVIKFPFGQVRLDQKKASILVGASWIISLTLAAIPLIFADYFQNKFYTKSGVCIALPLTRDRPPGWMYSVAIFVVLNFLTFVLVAFGQIVIFLEIKKTSTASGSNDKKRKRDLKIARNLLLVVATDFLCWFPIGVMGIIALSGHAISGDVYAWAAVFILPVNSALNPILYTVSAIIGQKAFNPSVDEQSRSDLSTECGRSILDFQGISHDFVVTERDKSKPQETYDDLRNILVKSAGISSRAALKIALRLANVLDILHSNSLVLTNLSVETLSVSVSKKRGIPTGKVQVKEQPKLSDMPEDQRNAIYQYGQIIRALLAARNSHR